MTRFAAGAATDIGQVRTVNQDNTLIGNDVFAVADGMGGHRGGEVASAVAVDALRNHFRTRTPMALVEAVREANHAIVERAAGDPELKGMGTTLCALASVRRDDGEEVLTIVNVGDSRAYLLKQGERSLIQISEDHSLVQQLVRQGQLTPDAAAVHPQRNILTRALGIDRDVKPDAFVILPVRGDRYLLCSDGLFNEVDEERIATVLQETADPRLAAELLVHLANQGGGRDNISVVVVDVIDDTGHHPHLAAESDDHRLVDVVRFGDRSAEIAAVDPETLERRSLRSDGPDIDLAASPPGAGPTGRAGRASRATAAPAGADPAAAPVPPAGSVTATRPQPMSGPAGPGAGAGGRTADAQPSGSVAPGAGAGGGRPPLSRAERSGEHGIVVDRPAVPAGVSPPSPPVVMTESAYGPEPRSRFTWRVLLFLVAFVGILVGAFYAINWVADNSYFVGLDNGQVTIFKGRPGGLLWRQPQVVEPTGMALTDVLEQFQGDVKVGHEQTTLTDAQQYVAKLRRPTTTTTSTTTTTTAPPGLGGLNPSDATTTTFRLGP